MFMKPTPRRYLWMVFLMFLAACGKQAVAQTPEPPFTQTAVLPTPVPTTVLASSFPTTIFIPAIITPSPLPTQPTIPVITPDATQVEMWKEYEDGLVQSILPTYSFESILCEWDILAQSGQEVYVWAVCASSNVSDWRPAVIHLEVDGSVHSVEIPKRGSSDINRMFPEEAQVKFSFYTGGPLYGRLKEMLDHLNYRATHPEEPPLIVLLAMPTPTSTP
jgi:hypothetical protein